MSVMWLLIIITFFSFEQRKYRKMYIVVLYVITFNFIEYKNIIIGEIS